MLLEYHLLMPSFFLALVEVSLTSLRKLLNLVSVRDTLLIFGGESNGFKRT